MKYTPVLMVFFLLIARYPQVILDASALECDCAEAESYGVECVQSCMNSESSQGLLSNNDVVRYWGIAKSMLSGAADWVAAAVDLFASIIKFITGVATFIITFFFAIFFILEMLLLVFFLVTKKAIDGFTSWIMVHVHLAIALVQACVWFVNFCLDNFERGLRIFSWVFTTVKDIVQSTPVVGLIYRIITGNIAG